MTGKKIKFTTIKIRRDDQHILQERKAATGISIAHQVREAINLYIKHINGKAK